MKLNVGKAAALLSLLSREDASSASPSRRQRLLAEPAPLLELAVAALTGECCAQLQSRCFGPPAQLAWSRRWPAALSAVSHVSKGDMPDLSACGQLEFRQILRMAAAVQLICVTWRLAASRAR